MKTIEERAKEYANILGATLFMDSPEEDIIYRDDLARAYASGAKEERAELTRWRAPDEELPADGVEVLCKVVSPHRTYDVLRHDRFGWWKEAPGGGWCAECWAVMAWRPIYENE